MQMRMIIASIYILVLGAIAVPVDAGGLSKQKSDDQKPNNKHNQIFLEQADYIQASLPNTDTSQLKAQMLWPNPELRAQLTDILGHKPKLRFRYWGADGKTVWILDEIGKERPITAGVVIENGKIADVQVLVFRESRGWEVKYDFFTQQFANLQLNTNQQLNKQVDNITGATLSVRAMTRMARAALLLHEHSNQASQSLANAR